MACALRKMAQAMSLDACKENLFRVFKQPLFCCSSRSFAWERNRCKKKSRQNSFCAKKKVQKLPLDMELFPFSRSYSRVEKFSVGRAKAIFCKKKNRLHFHNRFCSSQADLVGNECLVILLGVALSDKNAGVFFFADPSLNLMAIETYSLHRRKKRHANHKALCTRTKNMKGKISVYLRTSMTTFPSINFICLLQ